MMVMVKIIIVFKSNILHPHLTASLPTHPTTSSYKTRSVYSLLLIPLCTTSTASSISTVLTSIRYRHHRTDHVLVDQLLICSKALGKAA